MVTFMSIQIENARDISLEKGQAMYRAYFVKKNAVRIYKRYQADVDMILEQDGYTDCIVTE